MKKRNLNIFFLSVLGMLAATAADAAEFIDGMDDVPVAEGLTQTEENNVSFANDETRFVEVYLSGENISFAKVADFYRQTLPQLGWRPRGQENVVVRFERDGESLDMVREQTQPLLVRITLKNKNQD